MKTVIGYDWFAESIQYFSKPISTYYIEAKETGRTKNEQSCGKMGRNPSNCENGT